MDCQVFSNIAVWVLTIFNGVMISTTGTWAKYVSGTLERRLYPTLYATDIFPPVIFLRSLWAMVWTTNCCFFAWWWRMQSKHKLPTLKAFNFGWIMYFVVLVHFTYSFMVVNFPEMCLNMAVSEIPLFIAIYGVLKQRTKVQKILTQSQLWWYDVLGIQPAPAMLIWTLHAIVFLSTAGIAYKQDGPVDQPKLTGWCDPATTCATYFIPLMILLLILCIVLDIFVYPGHTKHIVTAYPTFCYTTVSVLWSKNAMWDGELRLNQCLYLGIGVISFVVWLFRGTLQNTFGKKHGKKD